MYRNNSFKEVVFLLNTLNPDEVDMNEVAKIRERIEAIAKEEKIPIRWFVLQQVLENISNKRGSDVMSKAECSSVSKKLGFTDEELDAALEFFDKLNIFLYKKDILPNVVFMNAQVPLDKLSELVEEQYHLKEAENDSAKATDVAISGDWIQFRNKGLVLPKLLEKFPKHYTADGIFTPQKFLSLLENLLIVSKIKNSPEYFFPAILQMKKDVHSFLTQSEVFPVEPLVVYFPTGWAPPGVFCCSVCHLQSDAGWRIKHCDTSEVSRNSLTFEKNIAGTITLVDNFSFFALCINIDLNKIHGQDLIRHCAKIKEEVFAAIAAGLEKTNHGNTDLYPAFLCPYHGDSTELYVATIEENNMFICRKDSNHYDSIDHVPSRAVWFGGPAPQPKPGATQYAAIPPAQQCSLDPADLFDVRKALVKVTDRWKDIGLALGLDYALLKKIRKENIGDLDGCLIEMLSQWLNKNYDTKRFGEPSWKLVAKAVADSAGGNNPSLAENICKSRGVSIP